MKTLSLFAVLLTLSASGLRGQPAAQEEAAIRTRSTVVLVDAVVRDRKGRPVTDLKASDFEIREDGIPQEISYVENFSLGEDTGKAPGATSSSQSNDPGRMMRLAVGAGQNFSLQGSFTAIVFDRLTDWSRSNAWEAARNYVGEIASGDTQVGVFVIDLALKPYQFFTDDRTRLLAAIDRAAGRAASKFASEAAELERMAEQRQQAQDLIDASAAAAAAAQNADYAPSGESQMNSMVSLQIGMIESFERLQREYQGYASTNALIAMVASLRALPGRKSILFFSDGVSIPAAVEARFRSVIDAANRAGVSIYTIDAEGLRLESTGTLAAGGIPTIGALNANITASGNDNIPAPLLRGLEKNEDLLRIDAHTGLKALAEKTGGLFIRQTNDLTAGLRQIDQDMHSYYLLAYTPKDLDFDGRFRQIEVSLKRPRLEIRYRKGYYAVDASFTEPLLEFEAPAVALLQSGRREQSLPVRSTTLDFPRSGNNPMVAVLAEIGPGQLAYRETETGEASDFSFVALVRNDAGEVVRKASQQYRIRRPEAGTSAGDSILFYKELELSPGRYSVEVAGFDAVSGKAGVTHQRLVLPESDPTLPGVSSVMILQGAERIGHPGRADDSPFHYQDLLFYPSMTARLQKSATPEVVFFFTVYPNGQRPREALVELERFNEILGRRVVSLPEPDGRAGIQMVRSIPVGDYPPGAYTLKISVPAGDRMVTRTRRFLLAP